MLLDIPGYNDSFTFGGLESKRNWRKEMSEESDDDILSADDRKLLVVMLGFDPAESL